MITYLRSQPLTLDFNLPTSYLTFCERPIHNQATQTTQNRHQPQANPAEPQAGRGANGCKQKKSTDSAGMHAEHAESARGPSFHRAGVYIAIVVPSRGANCIELTLFTKFKEDQGVLSPIAIHTVTGSCQADITVTAVPACVWSRARAMARAVLGPSPWTLHCADAARRYAPRHAPLALMPYPIFLSAACPNSGSPPRWAVCPDLVRVVAACCLLLLLLLLCCLRR